MTVRYGIRCATCGIDCPSAVTLTMSPEFPGGIIYRATWYGHHFPLGQTIEDFMKGHFGHDFELKAEEL